MGFGILFLGYFLTINFEYKGINLPPDFLGYILMMIACSKLAPYSDNFKYTNRCLIPLTVLSVGITAMEIMAAINSELAFSYIADIRNIKYLLMIVMHYLLLNALIDISKEVGRYKITNKCRRNIVLSIIMILIVVILTLPFSFPYKDAIALIATFVLLTAVVLLNSVQIFSCYMWICYEGDEDMPMKEPKDPLSKIVYKTQKENAEYKAKKAAEKEEKKKNKKKRK